MQHKAKVKNKSNDKLTLRGHHDARLCIDRILTPPQARDGLLLRVELQARLAVESACTTTCDALLVAGEGEHGEGDRDGTVVPRGKFIYIYISPCAFGFQGLGWEGKHTH